VAEATSEFGSEDPLIPMLRSVLDSARRKLDEVQEEVQGYVGESEVPEPGEEDVDSICTPSASRATRVLSSVTNLWRVLRLSLRMKLLVFKCWLQLVWPSLCFPASCFAPFLV
jgi:hypothetical protein